ncbi:MAG: hypothetical protein DI543_08605 [Bradyrhizobium icense]|jgi:hypothetical protein|nr:MAG: hypothetical protein DI543_08605 [Bradyrhizobium icense]
MRAGVALAFLVAMTSQAFAGGGFEIVIPAKPGVPIIINGVDASYAVVEGDWGLERRNHVQPTIYGGRYVDPVPNVGHYYPSSGHLPGYGRVEIEPSADRKQPQEAESYYRSWSAHSRPTVEIPQNPPPVIVAPQIDYDWQHGRQPRPRPR